MKSWLLGLGFSGLPGLGLGMMFLGVVQGGVLVLASTSTGDYVQGGVAAAAITFAGATVRYMGGMVDKERARGDRLEVALIDKVLPALQSAATAMTQAQEAIKEMRRGL